MKLDRSSGAVQFNFWIDRELYERLKAYADKRGLLLRHIAAKALSAYLDARKEEK